VVSTLSTCDTEGQATPSTFDWPKKKFRLIPKLIARPDRQASHTRKPTMFDEITAKALQVF
jgi:hypothetical protein